MLNGITIRVYYRMMAPGTSSVGLLIKQLDGWMLTHWNHLRVVELVVIVTASSSARYLGTTLNT